MKESVTIRANLTSIRRDSFESIVHFVEHIS